MKTLTLLTTVLSLLWFAPSSHAATDTAKPQQYKIAAEIFVAGKLISRPTVVTLSGQKAEVSQRSEGSADVTSMIVVAAPYEPSAAADPAARTIELNMEVDYVRGDKQLKATPRFIVQPGLAASMTVSEKGKDDLTLKVVVTPL